MTTIERAANGWIIRGRRNQGDVTEIADTLEKAMVLVYALAQGKDVGSLSPNRIQWEVSVKADRA